MNLELDNRTATGVCVFGATGSRKTGGYAKHLSREAKSMTLADSSSMFRRKNAANKHNMNGVNSRGAKAGRARALEAGCVESYADYLFNFAFGYVRNVSVAEDLVQETFLAALKSRSPFSGKSSQRTWLVGILRHKIYDHYRNHYRERAGRVDCNPTNDGQSREESVFRLHEMAAQCPSPHHRMELDEFRVRLEAALTELPTRIAQVFQLYVIEERSNREVCQHMKISQSNLWVMLHRGRKQLREHLDSWWMGKR